MGRNLSGTAGSFHAIDQHAAYEAFKSSGSFDPDTLYAQKETMLGPYRRLKRVAGLSALLGVVAVVVGLPLLGVVVAAGSWVLWRYQSRQARNVEAGYGQYIGTADERP